MAILLSNVQAGLADITFVVATTQRASSVVDIEMETQMDARRLKKRLIVSGCICHAYDHALRLAMQ